MNKIYVQLEQELEYKNECSSAATTSVFSESHLFTAEPCFDFNIIEPKIILSDLRIEDSDAPWFMEQPWFEGEEEAEKDIRQGRVFRLKNSKDAASFLRSNR